jgi:hypothetical protein
LSKSLRRWGSRHGGVTGGSVQSQAHPVETILFATIAQGA